MALPEKPEINLQELFNSNPTGVIYQNADGKIIAANPAAEKVLGKSFEEMKNLAKCSDGWNFIDVNEASIPEEKLPFYVALRTGKTVKGKVIGFYPEKEAMPRWMKMDAIPQFSNGTDEPAQVYINCQDITLQKNTEEELRQSEAKYKALIGNMYSSMLIIQNGEVKFANKALEELSGYNIQEILGSDFLTYLAPQERDKVYRFYIDRIKGNNVPAEYRTKVVKKNGQSIFVNIKVKTIQFGAEPAILVVMTDVDEQVHAEIKLKESEEKFRSIVQFINDGIVYIDENATILHVNKALTNLLETNPNRLVGKNALTLSEKFATKTHFPHFYQFILDGLKGIPVEPFEIEHNKRILEFSVSFDSNTGRVVGIVRDLTQQKQTERELIIQSRKASDALRGANLGTWEWNIQSGEMIFNQRCAEIIGFSLAEASGWTMQEWKERAHPDDVKKSEKRMQAHFNKKRKFYECEMRIRHKDGGWIWVMEKGKVATWSEEGKPLLISGTQQDITDRKIAEEEIKESERRLATLMDNLQGIAYRCKNNKNWTMEFLSNGCYELTGYRPAELIGPKSKPYAELIHPDDRELVYNEVQKALKKNAPFEVEYRIKTAGGTEKFVWEKGVGVYKKGELLFLEGFIHDITTDKKAEDALRNQELLLRQIAENYPNSFVSIIDKDLRVILSAGQEFKNQRINPDEQKGRRPEELFGEEGENVKEFYERTFRGEECDFELLLSHRFLHFRTVPIQNENNNIDRILVVIENISDKKQLWNDLVAAKEKAEESNRLKSAFLTTMNHELRTPLNHVIGFSEIIRDSSQEEKTKQFADTIFQSGQGLLEIIEDIFDLALTEKSVIKLRQSSFQTEKMYQEMKSILEELLYAAKKQDQVELILNPEEALLSQKIFTDKNKLVQVMTNLFKNAIKFTDTGSIEFGIYQTQNTYLNLYVRDTGIGIAEDKKDIIFEFFRQGDDSHTRKFGGVGIGLAISKKIAEAMDGSITVQSEPGKGSTFLFTVPLKFVE